VSHIPKFGDASKSPAGHTASPAGEAASPSEEAVVSHWRCIIYFRDAHPPHSHPHLPQETPHLPQEMWSHLQIAGYVTLLEDFASSCNFFNLYRELSDELVLYFDKAESKCQEKRYIC
jgi:hypothetical protein